MEDKENLWKCFTLQEPKVDMTTNAIPIPRLNPVPERKDIL